MKIAALVCLLIAPVSTAAYQDDKPAATEKPARPARGGKNGDKQVDAQQPEANAEPGELQKDADGRCAACRDAHFVPLERWQPYLHVEGQKPPKPELCVPWKDCPACRAELDPQGLVDLEAERLKGAADKHKVWEQQTKLSLVRVETRHATIHAQLPAQLAARQGEAAEALARHLQTLTKSVVLTPSRPDRFELLILWDDASYQAFTRQGADLPAFAGIQDWGLIRQVSGFSGQGVKVFNAHRNQQTPPEHMTISNIAGQQIEEATADKAKSWLSAGFPYYCEFALKRKNLVSKVKYMLGERPLGDNWNVELKKAAAARKLRPFEDMFRLDLRDFQPADHVMCFSMVSYLIRSNPDAFVRFVLLIRDGKEDQEALETAYGVTLKELQDAWEKWAGGL